MKNEITIPGDVLENEKVSDGAKLLYGKIAAFSTQEGYCLESAEFLYGTKSRSTVRRQIKELTDAGYIKIEGEDKNRIISISPVNSKFSNLGGVK